MQTIYDALISPIPAQETIEYTTGGQTWRAARSTCGTGVSMAFFDATRPPMLTNTQWEGLALPKAASAVMSWNFQEASTAMAVINSWYNTPAKLSSYGALKKQGEMQDAFLTYQSEIPGKNAAVIGHFPFLEKRFAPYCHLSILERSPVMGDYPDTACEYILPRQDFVFITGVTLINKTLPRLLELSKKARVVLVGPTVPMTPALFSYGIEALCGFVVTDTEKCLYLVENNTGQSLFQCGRMVTMTARDCKATL